MSGLVAIPIIPGVNCEHDVAHAISLVGGESAFVHHMEATLPSGTQAVYIPGGFSYGDYLRAGAIARFAPIVAAIGRAAADGMPVLGVCNGFQILCEAGLLPGALARNVGLRFLCQDVHLRVETAGTPVTHRLKAGNVLRIPINHGEGCYTAPTETIDRLEAGNQVLLRYCRPDGTVDPDDRESNPNGSLRSIAGVTNEAGNVAGMMPHPERASESILGSVDGLPIVESLVKVSTTAGVA
ncbi:MAG: phosphoribosylformylglycinamidine synthase subunit PurQ [Actinobacteria bacterium ATB1]|nr:phosphoribosylformylglycinamidine synthase subunit PurQ [Actinobacteria bacterium ATB1]